MCFVFVDTKNADTRLTNDLITIKLAVIVNGQFTLHCRYMPFKLYKYN